MAELISKDGIITLMEYSIQKMIDKLIEIRNLCEDDLPENNDNQSKAVVLCDNLISSLEELKQFKDKQEQGLLIDVPVKPEDDIYFIKLHFNGVSRLGKITIDKITIDAFEIRVCGYWYAWNQEVSFTLKEFNKTWFLTKDKAEEALAKMGGK